MWFNPPYSKSVKTNIGKNFSHLLVKHFPINNKMHTIFNKNTVKVSYSCMKNMDSQRQNHLGAIVEKQALNSLKWPMFDTKCNILR